MIHSNYFKISATGLVTGAATCIYSVSLCGGSDASVLTLYDAADAVSGVDFLTLKAAAATSVDKHYGQGQGQSCKRGIYATLTGTSSVAYIEIDGELTMTTTSTSTSTTSTSTSTTSTSTSTS
jgi:hypothetical protein